MSCFFREKQLMKCGDCIHWRKANARERRGYYFKKGAEPGKCKAPVKQGVCGDATGYGLFVDRNHNASRCKRFEAKPVLKKSRCGDCRWWYRFPSDRRHGACCFQLPKASAPDRIPAKPMSAANKKECCRWEEK